MKYKTKKNTKQECQIANQNCKMETFATCFACSTPCCVECSKRVTYFNYGRVRLCDNCLGDYRRK